MTMITRERAVSENLGLVRSVANRFRGRGIEYDDLYSAGCLGLVKAIDRFDESRGFKFSTYAVPIIMGEIKGLFRKEGTLKVSRSMKETAVKAKKARDDYMLQTGVEPTVKELARLIGESEEQTAQALCAARQPVSLTFDEDEEEKTLEIPVDSGEEYLAERLSLYQELMKLEDGDRRLIVLRYFKGLTQTQTAKILGLTQVRVSRKEKKILSELKKKLDE